MTAPSDLDGGLEKFTGLWTNEVGNMLFVELQPGPNELLVSFAPTKNREPVPRTCFANRPSIRMCGIWREDLGEVVVDLAEPNREPQLHLMFDLDAPYFGGPSLIPSISMDYSAEPRKEPDVAWLESLKPYCRVEETKWAEVFLVMHVTGGSSR